MIDTDACNAIRKAMENLTASNTPLNKMTVPQAAIQLMSGHDAPERIYAEIEAMVARHELEAGNEPWQVWRLI